jgi:sec-independent protein translocase protein TatC
MAVGSPPGKVLVRQRVSCSAIQMAKREAEAHMSLGEHLEELRRRVIHALLGLVPILVLALVFGKRILSFVLQPAYDAMRNHGDSTQVILTGPLEGFGTYMKLSMIAAIVVGSPWVLYQLWRFVSPGLYSHERRFVYFLLPLSTLLTVGSGVFLFYVIMPMILMFTLEWDAGLGDLTIPTVPLPEGAPLLPVVPILPGDPPVEQLHVGSMWIDAGANLLRICTGIKDGVASIISITYHTGVGAKSEYRASEYFKLLTSLAIAMGAAFQAPVVVLLLGWAGLVNQKLLNTYRRHALVVCAVIAAAIGPGDPASMVFLLIPLYLLYELGGVLLRVFPASRVAGKRREPEEQPDGEGS